MWHRGAKVALRLWVGAALLGGCLTIPSGLSITTTAPSGALEQIPASLYRPDGRGPFPAVVILHDCSGLGNDSSGAPNATSACQMRFAFSAVGSTKRSRSPVTRGTPCAASA